MLTSIIFLALRFTGAASYKPISPLQTPYVVTMLSPAGGLHILGPVEDVHDWRGLVQSPGGGRSHLSHHLSLTVWSPDDRWAPGASPDSWRVPSGCGQGNYYD